MRVSLQSLFIGLILVGLFAACETLIMDIPNNDASSVFQEAWSFVDEEYSFFAEKELDWNQSFRNYHQNVSVNTSDEELFQQLSAMLNELEDRHVNLCRKDLNCQEWDWESAHPINYNRQLLRRHYFSSTERSSGPYTYAFIGDVGYLEIRTFEFTFDEGTLTRILEDFQDRSGLIIDIRGNNGGELESFERLAGALTSETIPYGRTRFKSGKNPDEFSEWYEECITPINDHHGFDRNIALLTGSETYSAATFFAQALKYFPNVHLIGDSTGGGGGIPAYTELANGWILRCSNSQLVDLEGVQAEYGVAPDLYVDFVPSDGDSVDLVVEAALQWLGQDTGQ